ncbi:hypothetical protein OYT88_04665 [Sporolactobacillus sp. CQH2019]|uniref:hypothetical protein n=1 Tax=Sporolactobacillus sp. CQH2019 TaxID=3023512 RepID=UPI002368526F|nr:hypothetical protein [Sporolactobacillus sp. CQH2019]MDD9147841.1 hypothetical protein [Sporolactobacillus sp. CQH2019]
MEPSREFFCAGCGLFFWQDNWKDHICPNEKCPTHKNPGIPIFPVDSLGFFYFADQFDDFVKQMSWSSPKFAPDEAIKIYEEQGVNIID